MDMGGDVAGFAELQKALAEYIALPDNRLPFVKAHIFPPSVFGKVLARGQFRIWQGPHEVWGGRDHNDIFKQMRPCLAPRGKFVKPPNFEMVIKMRVQNNAV